MVKTDYSLLYAEDDDTIRGYYNRFFNIYCKEVHEASNGEEALNIYENETPDIVILDINMPIVSGLEVAKKIRESSKETKIILLTAYSQKEDLLKAIDLSVFKYLIKPVNTIELEEAMRNCIDDLNDKKQKNKYLVLENDFKWDYESDELLDKNHKTMKLTHNETQLFKLFCKNPAKTYSNDDILNYVWEFNDDDNYSTNKLRTLLSKLKNKISYNLFDSIYKVGYKIKIK